MAYASITITVPSSAKEGETVSASVRVTNTAEYHLSFKGDISALPELYDDYVIGSIDQLIMMGSSVTRNVSFTMPDCNVTIFIWLECWMFGQWKYAGAKSKVVSLEIPVLETFHLSISVPSWAAGGYIVSPAGSGDYPAYSTVPLTAHPLSGYKFTSWGGDASGTNPTYNLYMDSDKNVEAYFEPVSVPVEGTISRKELEYDETRGSIPVYNIPQGERGLVHIWGRNDMTTNQKLGIAWIVRDPDGMIVEEYEDWEWGTTGPGSEHEFIGGRFNLDREKYTMWVNLLMNPDNPEVVDRYIGDLCTVEVAVPEFAGTISRKELEYDETRENIPVY